ncbi:hypothetical protein Holit_03289 [Hollandina sp. SP2]
MKKALRMGSAALLVFALIVSACNDAYDLNTTETETIPSLAGPGNVKAVNEQAGVITLTWDPVYDAKEYEVWRKAGEEPAVKVNPIYNKLFSDGTRRYDDIISATNLLKPDIEYTYTVVAISNASTSRSVGIVQNGVSEPVTITPAHIPAAAEAVVLPVEDITVAVDSTQGYKRVLISWDKNPNPGVHYKGKFGGADFSQGDVSLSPDGKAVYSYDYWDNRLTDGEQYKAEVTAYYSTGYYQAAAPAESEAYTHSRAWQNAIVEDFTVSPVTVYTTGAESGYEVNVYWRQVQAPAGLTYELYRHELVAGEPIWDDNRAEYVTPWVVPENVEWDPVPITQPTPDALGFVQFKLTGAQVPAYRQQWTYKLEAKVNGETFDSDRGFLTSGVWSSSVSINLWGTELSGETGKKIRVIAPQISSGLYAGEVIEFYTAPSSLYNSSNQMTYSDSLLSQFIKLGEFSKTKLGSATVSDRTVEASVSSAGYYTVIAVLKNGATRIQISSYSDSVGVPN